jgi:hypothetical protein
MSRTGKTAGLGAREAPGPGVSFFFKDRAQPISDETRPASFDYDVHYRTTVSGKANKHDRLRVCTYIAGVSRGQYMWVDRFCLNLKVLRRATYRC